MIPLFLSSTASGYYLGHEFLLRPLFATSEVLFVFTSWLLFIRVFRKNYILQHAKDLILYLIIGVAVPLLIYEFYLSFLLMEFKGFDANIVWNSFYYKYLGDYITIITFSLLLFLVFKKEHRFNIKNFIGRLRKPKNALIILTLIVFESISIYKELEFYEIWFIYGLLLLSISLYRGYNASIILNFYIFFNAFILTPITEGSEFINQESNHELFNILEYLSLSIFGVILGKSVSDKKALIFSEKELTAELQQKNAQLTTAKKYFAKIYESSPNLIAIIRGEDGKLMNLNQEGIRMINLNSSQHGPADLSVYDLISKDVWKDIARNPNLESSQFEFSIRRFGLSPILCNLVIRRFWSGNSILYLLNATDITEQRAAENKIKQANYERIELNKKISEYKIMALQSSMSPHFIFNCMNSIQYFILKNNKEKAVFYLTIFSKLIRKVLDISTKSRITLNIELDILKYYVELEKLRFEHKFECIFDIDPSIDPEDTEIPPLLLQPFVENAIIHGLSHKKERGILTIGLACKKDFLRCVIQDNGVGRHYHQNRKKNFASAVHQSKGMTLTKNRLSLYNKDHIKGFHIFDLKDKNDRGIGTKVEILINTDSD
ncbi:MAG: histidine kinase [Cytophagales bacterium]|nr:histidine kinase [Cytophagales bacterium]